MTKIKKLSKKTIAIILSVCILAVSLPLMLIPFSAADSEDPRVVDPSTFNSWQQLFPADNTTQAGRIWTDKSVFTSPNGFGNLVDAAGRDYNMTMKDDENNFLVALSALASNKSIVGYSYTPTDTMLVLDISGSMSSSSYVSSLVTAANDAITRLLALNKHNRVGVVLYSDSANGTVLLPLDRYTAPKNGSNAGKYLNNSGQSYIQVVNGVENSDGDEMEDDWISVVGGTYLQSGIYTAMSEFLNQTETVIPDGELQAGTARTPIFVVMSDGLVTYATNNYAAQNNNQNQSGLRGHNIGSGSSNQNQTVRNAMDFVTQLTAAYAKHKVDEHYEGATPLFYTLGLGSSGTSLNSAPLNPSAHTSTDELWEDYLDTRTNSNLVVSTGSYGNYTSVKKIAEISDISQLDYVTKFHPATNAAGLIEAFGDIVKQIIIQSLYYPTLVEDGIHDHDGFVEFVDDIGHYMDVKDIKGIMLGDVFYTGEYLAQNFTEDDSAFFNPDGSYSDLGNNLVWSVKERIGITDVAVARDLINSAYNSYQLRSWDGGWSNYIGWYADKDGKYLGHWHEGHTENDIPDGAVFINKSYGLLGAISGEYTDTNLMYISTQIHTRIDDGNVSVIWRIPASLIPVITYNITIEGESLEDAEDVKIEYEAAEPIRLVFEVGLSDELNAVNLNEKVTDKAAHIIDVDNDGISDDGKYYFYTNWWNDDNLSHENPSKTEDTIVLFEPSLQNERYYYSEETAVYINTGSQNNPVYTLYKGAKPTTVDSNTYYRKYAVFLGTGNAVDGKIPGEIEWHYEEMSDSTIGVLTDECRNADGSWDVPAGTVHRVLEPYNLPKNPNETGTLPYVRYPVISNKDDSNTFYIGSLLGNNGRYSMDIPQGIKLTKVVDETLFGTTEYFTFEIESNISQLEDAAIYHENVTGELTEIDPEYTGGKLNVRLKAGESVYVLGLEAGSVVAVTEKINGEYKVSKLTVNDSVLPIASDNMNTTIVADSLTRIEFENTLVVNDGTIVVSKEVNHDSNIPYNNNHEFSFEVYPVGDYDARETFKIKAGASYTLSGLAPGDYIVNEIESELPSGFTPKQNLVTVTANNEIVATVHFINDYVAESVKPALVVSGTKNFTGREWKSGDVFEFALEIQQGAEWEAVGNTRKVSFSDAVKDYKFDFANDADLSNFEFKTVGTYYFRVREVIPQNKLGGVTYDEIYRYFSVVVTDATMDGKLEVSAVNAYNPATVVNANNVYTVDVDFNNSYAPIGSDEVVIKINKTVDDKVGTDKGYDGYTFGVYAAEGTEPIITSAPTNADGETSFNLSFPASVVGQTFNFKVKEIVPEDKLLGMDYDTTAYDLVIEIVDNLDGTISALIKQGTTQTDTVGFGFTNVYKPAAAEVELSGTKVLEGRPLNNGEFTFELYKEGEATAVDTANNNANGIFTFEELTFDTVGTYNYTVKELKGDLGGVDYSTKTYAVKIVVSDDADNDGDLDYEVYIDNVKTADDDIVEAIEFVNIYSAAEVEITLKATKKLSGRDIIDGEFKFDLYAANDDFLLGDIIYNDFALVKVDAETGLITFHKMTFGEEGSYKFVILEDELDEKGIVTDKHKYQIEIIVTDNGTGNLVAEVKVDGVTVTGDVAAVVVFNNAYTVDPTDIVIEAEKDLTGAELKGNDFTFQLFDEDGNLIESVKNDKDGKVAFSKLNITEAGTYSYTIKELNDGAKGYTYDETEYTVTVSVRDGGEGLFEVEIVYSNAEGEVEKAVFENTFTPEVPQTDDGVSAIAWFMLMIISGGLALSLIVLRKKQNA